MTQRWVETVTATEEKENTIVEHKKQHGRLPPHHAHFEVQTRDYMCNPPKLKKKSSWTSNTM